MNFKNKKMKLFNYFSLCLFLMLVSCTDSDNLTVSDNQHNCENEISSYEDTNLELSQDLVSIFRSASNNHNDYLEKTYELLNDKREGNIERKDLFEASLHVFQIDKNSIDEIFDSSINFFDKSNGDYIGYTSSAYGSKYSELLSLLIESVDTNISNDNFGDISDQTLIILNNTCLPLTCLERKN